MSCNSPMLLGTYFDSFPASFHAMDHMAWDGGLYPHMSAHGKHPYYVLGKGLFLSGLRLIGARWFQSVVDY